MGIDFTNKKIFKLNREELKNALPVVTKLLTEGEMVIDSYVSMRDRVVFTNKRVIAVNVQGLTGTKKCFTSIPYNKIQFYSVETSGTLDLDAELELYLAGGMNVKFEFFGKNNIQELCKIISDLIL
ncbi:MAG: PH domain-containing protein [Clostridia bacterium]|nr:PH domain-containing protein [Clostridia bacterium]